MDDEIILIYILYFSQVGGRSVTIFTLDAPACSSHLK